MTPTRAASTRCTSPASFVYEVDSESNKNTTTPTRRDDDYSDDFESSVTEMEENSHNKRANHNNLDGKENVAIRASTSTPKSTNSAGTSKTVVLDGA